ncbi:MAG: phosphoribosylglycinamide formyltransferase [Fimbriimonadales bacterium]|nr:MAG: phosphoribosylglycinamide formyltransferase [Fimbriimonadales bacterium]
MERGRLAILVGSKGRGSNMEAIVRASQEPDFPMEVAVVFAPSDTAPAIERARSLGVPVVVLPAEPEAFAQSLLREIAERNVDLLCLAGYMRLIPASVVEALRGRILNIHPALLPKFGGKGMYGMRVHEAVLAAGEAESGATVHFVNERYDEGDILIQRRVTVLPNDTPETLAARVLEQEHRAYPEAIRIWWERYGKGRKASL